MNTINEAPNLGDLLKYEEDSLRYSREVATVAAGQNLELGAVVARETASGKLKRLDPAASDGTEVATGILLLAVDASLMDVAGSLLLSRHAVVASSAVIWPVGISAPDQTAATDTLATLGILIRQSA
jgi:hypothetical protein